jgi:hypothetical protein
VHLAQINVATLRAPLDDPLLADFVAGIEPINAVAERAPGFVWRHVEDVTPGDPRVVVNMSVWRSIDDLRAFTYAAPHIDYVRRRRDWFERMEVFLAMWWVDDGHRPTLTEGFERLASIREHGSSAHAFTFSATYEPDGSATPPRAWPPHAPRR